MRFGDPVRGSFFGWRNAFCCGVLLLSIGAIRTCAQDVAGAARQEKARKADEQRPAPHVYTEEDLRRPTILTPEDQARVEARKQQIAVPAQQNAEKTPDDPNDLNESLGEIARRYRLEIAEREAELARGKKFTAFPYDVPQKSVAAPKPGIESLAIEKPRVRNGRVTSALPTPVMSHGRVSPFQPRPLETTPSAAPAAPVSVLSAAPVRVPDSLPPSVKLAPAMPTTAGMQRVEVQRGQSWWKLAAIYLRNGARWRELRALNTDMTGPAELLKLGSTVVVPETITAPKATSSRQIKVAKGDSLWSIAYHNFGHGTAWRCLATANPQITDYSRVEIGATLHLPQPDALKSCIDRSHKD